MYKIDIIDTSSSYYTNDESLEYIRFLPDGRTVMCDRSDAEGILSNDKSTIYQFNKLVTKHDGYMSCVLSKINFADVLNAVIDNATTIESNVDYLMLLNDPDSAAETTE